MSWGGAQLLCLGEQSQWSINYFSGLLIPPTSEPRRCIDLAALYHQGSLCWHQGKIVSLIAGIKPLFKEEGTSTLKLATWPKQDLRLFLCALWSTLNLNGSPMRIYAQPSHRLPGTGMMSVHHPLQLLSCCKHGLQHVYDTPGLAQKNCPSPKST